MKTPAPNTTEPETLLFGYGETELGQIVVAKTGRGVAALFLGDDRAKLFRDLAQAFPRIPLVLDQAALETTIGRASSMIDTPRAAVELPLDLRGSPMKRRLRFTPPKQTLAQRSGRWMCPRALPSPSSPKG